MAECTKRLERSTSNRAEDPVRLDQVDGYVCLLEFPYIEKGGKSILRLRSLLRGLVLIPPVPQEHLREYHRSTVSRRLDGNLDFSKDKNTLRAQNESTTGGSTHQEFRCTS